MMMQASARIRGKSGNVSLKGLLKGKLFDETGDRLTPSHASKQGRRYRYYLSHRLITNPGDTKKTGNSKPGWRLPAEALEQQLSEVTSNHLEQAIPRELIRNPDVEMIQKLAQKMHQLRLKPKVDYCQQMLSCLKRAEIKPGSISISLCIDETAAFFDIESGHLNLDVLSFRSPFQLQKRGVETKLIIGDTTKVNIDAVLIHNISLAHVIYENLKSGKDIKIIAKDVGLSKRRILQLIDHAFLSPQITKSILQGRQPFGLTTEWLQRNQIPSGWKEQETLMATL